MYPELILVEHHLKVQLKCIDSCYCAILMDLSISISDTKACWTL